MEVLAPVRRTQTKDGGCLSICTDCRHKDDVSVKPSYFITTVPKLANPFVFHLLQLVILLVRYLCELMQKSCAQSVLVKHTIYPNSLAYFRQASNTWTFTQCLQTSCIQISLDRHGKNKYIYIYIYIYIYSAVCNVMQMMFVRWCTKSLTANVRYRQGTPEIPDNLSWFRLSVHNLD